MPASQSAELLRRIRALERKVERGRTKLPRDDFAWSGGHLLGALQQETRFGGGRLIYTFNGLGPVNGGAGATTWTETNIDASNYAAVTPTDVLYQAGGGSYVTLNGSDEYLVITDPAWAEPGAEELFVWQWAYITSVAAGAVTVAKDTNGAGHKQWALLYSSVSSAFRFRISSDGTAETTVDTTHSSAVDTWYFLAGYYQASTTLNIYVGAATDVELTEDTNVVGIPANISAAGTPDLTLGAFSGGSAFWPGKIGIGAGWLNVPAANIATYAQRMFTETRWAYGGY